MWKNQFCYGVNALNNPVLPGYSADLNNNNLTRMIKN